ncbi:MAG TPA: hypothetical protein VN207_06090 [Ktedonobacteraceae bacterium]|nr:hypothetical protein [Ktedonobacteraceae bacterium]
MQGLSKIEPSGTNINSSTFNNPLGLSSIYQSVGEVTAGAVSQLRQPLPIWDENMLIAIGEQWAEGLLEILPRLKEEVAYRIALMFVPYLQTEQEPQDEDGSVQESALLGSDSDIERAERAENIMQSILSKQGVKETGKPCLSKLRFERESHFRWKG